MRWQVGVELFAARRVSGAPVVDDSGVVIGVVSRIDVLACQLRADEAIRGDVAALLRSKVLSREVGVLRTSVSQGVVHLVGHVCGRTAAEAVWCPLSVEE